MGEDLLLLYVTAPTNSEARKIAHALVRERLAACVNILGEVESVYHWEGEVKSNVEIAFLVKSRAELIEEISERIKKLHSFECPCIISLDGELGSSEFMNWISQNTKTKSLEAR